MRQRENFELLIEDLHRGIAAPSSEDRRSLLWHSSWGIVHFTNELKSDPFKMGSLIGALRLLRESGGAGVATAEEKVLRTLDYIVMEASFIVGTPGEPSSQDDQRDRAIQVLQIVGAYALDCLHFRKKRRDAFGGRRRRAAFEILEAIRPHVAIPGVQDIALSILAESTGDDTRGAIDFLKHEFALLETQPNPEITTMLLDLVERTDSRSVAFGALDLLVDTGIISEFEALDRMSDWKERMAGTNR